VARYYKKWEEHSPRWQREQSRKGLDKKRWNAWLKLSDKTRRTSTPDSYAAGKSIASQSRERKEQQVVQRMVAATTAARVSLIRRNVSRMSNADLDWTLKATNAQIRTRAANKELKGKYGGSNPWWYR
jgi:hypothetical protein